MDSSTGTSRAHLGRQLRGPRVKDLHHLRAVVVLQGRGSMAGQRRQHPEINGGLTADSFKLLCKAAWAELSNIADIHAARTWYLM